LEKAAFSPAREDSAAVVSIRFLGSGRMKSGKWRDGGNVGQNASRGKPASVWKNLADPILMPPSIRFETEQSGWMIRQWNKKIQVVFKAIRNSVDRRPT
jgi:hypothetical protein